MREPVRILQMIGSLNVGGSQTMILNLYRHIDRDLVQFDFIIDHENERYFAAEAESLGAKIYTMPAFTGKNLGEVRRAWDTFFTDHPEYRVLHSHVRSYASVYLPIAKKHGVKTIVHSHSTSNGKGLTAIAKHLLQIPLRYQADYLFGCSEKAAVWLFGKRAVASGRYRTLPNGVDIDAYRPDPAVREAVRKKLGMEEKKVLIHVGRLMPVKNHAFLLDVFSEYRKCEPDSVLLLVGDGDSRPAIEQKIRDLSLGDSVILLGNRSDVPSLLGAADVFLLPSLWEGLPVTVIEAQAAGLRCLISDTVTREVCLSDLVLPLPIREGTGAWVEALKAADRTRKDVTDSIRKTGYDVAENAKELAAFYLSVSSRGRETSK